MFKKSDMDKSKFKDVELPEKELLNLKSKLEYEYFSKIKHLTEKVINLHLKTNKQLLDINCTSSSTLERYCNILHPHKNTDTAITRIKIIIESLEFIFFKKKNGVLSVKTKEELSDLINNNWEFSYTVYYWDWTNKAVEEGELKVNEDWNVAELTINNPKTKFKHIYEGNLEQTTTTSIFFNLWDYSNEEIGIGLSLTLYIGLSRKENRKFLQGTFSTIDRNVQMPVCGIVFAISTEPLKEQEDIKEIMVNNLFYKTLLTKSKVLNSYEETTDINSWKNLKNILDKKFEGFFIKPNSIQNDNTKLEKCTLIFGKDSKVTIGFLSGKTILGYCHIIGSGSLYIQFDYQLHERYSRFCMIFSTEISTLDKWYYGISSGLISNKSQPFINRIAIREINESTDINFEPFKIVDSKEKANEFFSKEERLKDFLVGDIKQGFSDNYSSLRELGLISSYSTKKINFSNTFCVNYETFSITRDFDIDKNVEKFKIIKQPLFIREGGEVILHFKENVIFEGYAEYTNRNIFINFNHRIEANNENQCFGTMIFPTIGYNQINYSYGISLFEETNHNYAESRVQVLKKAKNQNEEDLKYEEAEIDDKCPLFNKWKSDIEISKIIDHLMGRINRIIIPHHNQSVNRPPSPRQKEFRQLHFFSACYHASINNLTESINMLKNAKLHGFGTVSEDIKEIEIAKPIFKTAGILKELEIFENKVNH